MTTKLTFGWLGDLSRLPGLAPAATRKAAEWAGRDALRALTSGAPRAVRERKALALKVVKAGMRPSSPRKGAPLDALVWRLTVRGNLVPMAAYPHKDTQKRGVWVTVNKGARKQLRHAFEARLRNGHVGIFQRVAGSPRLPIKELFTTRLSEPVGDVAPQLLEKASAAAGSTWRRVIARELVLGRGRGRD